MAACRSGIDLQVSVDSPDGRTVQAAYGPERHNCVQLEIPPPLEAAWSESLSGGTGNTIPLCAGDFAFIPTQINGVDVYDVTTGKEAGWITLPGAVLGTPAIDNGIIYVPLSGGNASLAAVRTPGGTVEWLSQGESVETAVLLVDSVAVTAGVYGTIRCGSLRDSTTHWTRKLPKPVIAPPAAIGNTVFAACTNGDMYALALADGKEIWRAPTGSALHSQPVAGEGRVFAVNRSGRFLALDIETGKPLWDVDAGAPVYSSPALGGGHLLLAVSNGLVKAYQPSDGKLAWEHDLGSVPAGSPVIAGTVVVVAAMNGKIALLELCTGRPLWSATLNARIRTSPLVFPGGICVIGDEGELFGFKAVK